MRLMMTGLAGYVKFRKSGNENVRVVDTAITVVGTLAVAVTWVLVR